jgi:hypothetical protein
MAELMHQGLVGHARPKCQYNVGVTDLGEFMAFFGENTECHPAGTPPAFTDSPLDPSGCRAAHMCPGKCR